MHAILLVSTLQLASFSGHAPRLADASWFAQHAAPSVSLLDGAPLVPHSLDQSLTAELWQELRDEANGFAQAVLPDAGGGEEGPVPGPIAALAFVLGVIPGFGLGHLVSGAIYAFIGWLIIDVVIGVLLFWLLPVVIFPTVGYIWTIAIIVQVVERLIEGYAAFRVAEYRETFVLNDQSAPGTPAALAAVPNLFGLRF